MCLYSNTSEHHHDVRYFTDLSSIGLNIHLSNTNNFILSIRPCNNITTFLLPTILLSPHSSALFHTFQHPRMLLNNCADQAITVLVWTSFASLFRCSTRSYLVAIIISKPESPNCIQVLTWVYVHTNELTISSSIWGHSYFTLIHVTPYTWRPSHHTCSCSWISLRQGKAYSSFLSFWGNQSAPSHVW